MQTSISMYGAGNGARFLTTLFVQPLTTNETSGTLHAIRQQSRTCLPMLVSSQSCLRLLSGLSSLPNRDPAEKYCSIPSPEEMSRRPGTTSRLPAFDSDKMRNFRNRMGGATTQPEATTLVPQMCTSTEGIQTWPLVETKPPSPPPPPPVSLEPPPPPPLDSSYGQAQSQVLDPHAQSFLLLNHPQPLLAEHLPQPSQYGHHHRPPPTFCPPAPLPPGFYVHAPPGSVAPPLPYNPRQTGIFVGPSRYEMQLQVPHMQNWRHLQSNRSDHRGRREGRGARSYNTNNSRHMARPLYDSNARRFSNSSAAPLNTVAQTVGSRTPPWRQGSRPALINTTVATDTPRRNGRDGSTQTQSQPPELQVENTSPPQQVSRTTQTEEGFIPADTAIYSRSRPIRRLVQPSGTPSSSHPRARTHTSPNTNPELSLKRQFRTSTHSNSNLNFNSNGRSKLPTTPASTIRTPDDREDPQRLPKESRRGV